MPGSPSSRTRRSTSRATTRGRHHPAQARRSGRARRRPRADRRRPAVARPAPRQPRRSGRALLAEVPTVLSTPDAAGARPRCARAWRPGSRPSSAQVVVTAVPARHGPEGAEALSGPVTGFVLEAPGQPTVYVVGDNASLDVVDAVARRFPAIDLAVLFVGGANVGRFGDEPRHARRRPASAAADLLAGARIVPVHHTDWAHFVDPLGGGRGRFAAGGRSDRLVVLERGRPTDASAGRRVPRNSASRSCSSPTAALVRADHGTHSSSSSASVLPFARGRQVPTISPSASTAPGPADGRPERLVAGLVGHQQLAVASLQVQVVRAEQPHDAARPAGPASAARSAVEHAGRRARRRRPPPRRRGQRCLTSCSGRVEEGRRLLRGHRAEQVQQRRARRSNGPSSPRRAGGPARRPGRRATGGSGAAPGERCPARARARRAGPRGGTASRTCASRRRPRTTAGTGRSSPRSSGWRARPCPSAGRRPSASCARSPRARRRTGMSGRLQRARGVEHPRRGVGLGVRAQRLLDRRAGPRAGTRAARRGRSTRARARAASRARGPARRAGPAPTARRRGPVSCTPRSRIAASSGERPGAPRAGPAAGRARGTGAPAAVTGSRDHRTTVARATDTRQVSRRGCAGPGGAQHPGVPVVGPAGSSPSSSSSTRPWTSAQSAERRLLRRGRLDAEHAADRVAQHAERRAGRGRAARAVLQARAAPRRTSRGRSAGRRARAAGRRGPDRAGRPRGRRSGGPRRGAGRTARTPRRRRPARGRRGCRTGSRPRRPTCPRGPRGRGRSTRPRRAWRRALDASSSRRARRASSCTRGRAIRRV